jgi:hypothetical protein
MSIKRETGSTLEAFCSIERNTTIKYDFSEDEITVNTAAVAGIHDCSVTLYDAEGRIIGSPRFTMVVSDRVMSRDDVVLTPDDRSAVDAMLVKEAARQVAEGVRENAEVTRANAETNRASVETSRAEAEIKREQAETARELAETARAKAEDTRALAEKKREESIAEIKEALENDEFHPKYGTVTVLASAWEGTEDPYSQVVKIPNVTENSRVDLLPTVEQLAIFHDKDITFITENEGGVVTVYCIGDKPTQDYTMEICITEVKICEE